MKIVVIGTGAMGSVYAGLLADAGNEVWAVDLWAAHLDAIRERGLRVEGASGDRVVQSLKLASSTADIGPADLVIIATKAAGVAGAAASLPPLLTQKTLVLTIQNGLGAGERIGRHMKTGTLRHVWRSAQRGRRPMAHQDHDADGGGRRSAPRRVRALRRAGSGRQLRLGRGARPAAAGAHAPGPATDRR
jgi:2-dehydropantoate 2-reductase